MMPVDDGQMPRMVPTAQLLSTMLEPSSGSQHTQNLPSSCILRTSGSSSEAPDWMSGSVLQMSHIRSSASTSTPSCTSPKTLACFSATVTSSLRSASVIVPQPSNMVLMTERRSASAIFVASTSSSVS